MNIWVWPMGGLLVMIGPMRGRLWRQWCVVHEVFNARWCWFHDKIITNCPILKLWNYKYANLNLELSDEPLPLFTKINRSLIVKNCGGYDSSLSVCSVSFTVSSEARIYFLNPFLVIPTLNRDETVQWRLTCWHSWSQKYPHGVHLN